MNILLINGSPKGDGSNTLVMAENFLEGISQHNKNLNITKFNLIDKDFNNCSGCFGCWSKEKVECVIDDDMSWMFKRYIEADLIIWVTPLFHYTVSSLLKRFIERTLPMNSPLQFENGDKFYHPTLYKKTVEQKHILFSTCGFPEHNNFEMLKEYMLEVAEGKLVENICQGMGDLFKVEEFNTVITDFLKVIQKSGEEFNRLGKITDKTKELLSQPLISKDIYLNITNQNWRALGCKDLLNTENNREDSQAEEMKGDINGEGYNYLNWMMKGFNKKNNQQLDVIIEYNFTDIGQCGYFHIKNNSISLKEGAADSPNLKIETSIENWRKISNGEIDGTEALLKGLYKFDGDLSILTMLNTLFINKNSTKELETKDEKFYGIKAGAWLGIAFIPWIISWNLISFNTTLATLIPLVISLATLFLKKRVKAVTYFENLNGLYFLLLALLNTLFEAELQRYGVSINFFSLAGIWLFSILNSSSITAEYFVMNKGVNLSENPIFHKTNNYITLFWGLLYIIQGSTKVILDLRGFEKLFPVIFIFTFLGFIFTNSFQKWYPAYLLKGK